MQRTALASVVVLLAACGGGASTTGDGAAVPRDAVSDRGPVSSDAAGEDATMHDAAGPPAMDAAEEPVEPDAAVERDAAAPAVDSNADEADASTDAAVDAALDVLLDAGGSDAGPAAECPVRTLNELYPGFIPTNPYTARPAATACVAQRHDVIVVLGCPNNDDGTPATCQTRRADMAVSLWRAGLGDQFITSGAAVHNRYVEADTLAELLIARGVPAERVVRESRALHTDENIYYSSLLMQPRGWTTAIVVSEDPGHLIMSAVCDANCCVRMGRLTVFDYRVMGATMALGHYVLAPPAGLASAAECSQIQFPSKLMCTNLASRNACMGRVRL